MAGRILTINSGSSSIKFAVYDAEISIASGKLDGAIMQDRDRAIAQMFDRLRAANALDGLAAIGYRIVHGGMHHAEPELLTPALLNELRDLSSLAPDHLPDQIRVIEAVTTAVPDLPAVACFDTAFHRTMPRIAQLYGLTRALADAGVVRYGFHGLSYAYIVDRMRQEGTLSARTVIAHLGNGASMAAVLNGQSIDTSMGLTPTGGFVMSSRSGDLDPGVVLHLLREKKMPVDEVAALVNKSGGLKGLSGFSSDMQELQKDPRGAEAIAVFCYQVKKFLGAYAAALGGLDTLVFTGGIGENAPAVRAAICENLQFLGIEIDPARNLANAPEISTGAVKVRVIKTNEELMIARFTAVAFSSAGPTST